MPDLAELLYSGVFLFCSLFVVVDPVGLIPSFLVMTRQNTVHERLEMARLASWLTALILLGFAFAGRWVLQIFSITIPAFEIAGGLILFVIALDLLRARRTPVKETPEEEAEGIDKADIAMTPLAVPMLAGPGSITTVILFGNRATSVFDYGVLALTICLIAILTYLILRFVIHRSASLNQITLKVTARLMGLFLTAFAVQLILNGLEHSRLFEFLSRAA